MKHSQMKSLHEKYHSKTSVQPRIIDDNNFTYILLLKYLKKYIKTNENLILDIGCGAGTIDFYLAARGNKIIGIDISDKAIRTCNESAKALELSSLITFHVMEFPKQIPSQLFDFIICSEVLEHIPDDTLGLSQIYRRLKNKGVAIISSPSENAPLCRLGMLKKFDEEVGHVRRYTVKQLEEKCLELGFRILAIGREEGILRNFLFTNSIASIFIRIINKFNLGKFVTFLDRITLKLFGESQIFIILQKK